MQLQVALIFVSLLYFFYIRCYKVPIEVSDTHHRYQLKSLPSILRILPSILFSQLVSKYGYKEFLFNTAWGKARKLPSISITLGPFTIDLQHLKQYLSCVGIMRDFKENDSIPFSYFHCLLQKPLLVMLCQHKEFPLKLVGAVHYQNKCTFCNALYDKGSTIWIEQTVNEQIYFTTKQDLTFSVMHRIFAYNHSDTSKHTLICEMVDTYLVRAPKQFRVNGTSDKVDYFDIGTMGDVKKNEYEWPTIAGNESYKYALICGDMNPIHVHWLFARMFGFKSNIMHGMWSVAKILHQIMGHVRMDVGETITTQVLFERPLFLANQPKLSIIQDLKGTQTRFKLFDRQNKQLMQGFLNRNKTS